MAMELDAVAVAIDELQKVVSDAKDKVTNFKTTLKRLESTLEQMVPLVDQLSRLNQRLNLQQDQLKEFITILKEGEQLVRKCLKISSLNFIKKFQYSRELVDLDYSLLKFLRTILPLDDQTGATEESLLVVREFRTLLKADKDEEEDEGAEELSSRVSKTEISNKENLCLLEGCPCVVDFEGLLRSAAEVLGKGTYGTTYWAYAEYGGVVIKRLRSVKVDETEFQQRIKHLREVGKHPNIMPPLGFYFSCDQKLVLYDYAPGSLYALLHGDPGSERIPLDWDSRFKITFGAAKGISHLHSSGDFHGNIKSSNVLVTRDLEGCISEYGLSPLVNFPPSNTSKAVGHHAPKIAETWGDTQKSDVYNFGVMVVEIITRKFPAQINLSWVHSDVQKEQKVEAFDLELLQHNDHVQEMVQMLEIAVQCTVEDTNKRPKMDDVVMMIKSIRSSA